MLDTSRTLIADNDCAVVDCASHMLAAAGFQILPATSVLAVLDLCHEHHGPLHMALLDHGLGGTARSLVVEELIRAHPEVAIVFLSSQRSERYQPSRANGRCENR